jgi:hypothetical protein
MPDLLKLRILIPVYNDWASFYRLVGEIDAAVSGLHVAADIVAIDDGSTRVAEAQTLAPLQSLKCVGLIRVFTNQGHQRALAIGLAQTYKQGGYDAVMMLDSDGEDRPQEIPALIEAFQRQGGGAVVAQRAERSEGPVFGFFYRLYQLVFRCLTGKAIDFGNFCIVDAGLLERLVHSTGAWNHIAATIVQLGPAQRVKTRRGRRYFGKSGMDGIALVMHGLGAVAVFSAIALTRILVGSLIAVAALAIGILAVVGVRIFTDLAIPGWATNVVLLLSIMLVQLIVLSGGACLVLVNRRSASQTVPATGAAALVKSETVLLEKARWEQRNILAAS